MAALPRAISRRHIGALALGAALAAGLAAAGVAAGAEGPTIEQLSAQDWVCAPAPPFVVPPRIACSNPGLGRPSPGMVDPPPAYMFLVFHPDGSFWGSEHLIRADLYRGQRCAGSGEPYVLRALIGYYECVGP
jgi:hypothetical protein